MQTSVSVLSHHQQRFYYLLLSRKNMKRLCGSDSLSAGPNSTDGEDQVNNTIYTREMFQSMVDGLDEEACADEHSGHVSEKKRRLSVDQVKALEKNFEVENRLEPERKLKLADELNLQPRQVAVWFQNRRARWKTKQLERDYGVLKASYDGLKLGYEKLQRDNEALLKEIKELKSKLSEEVEEDIVSADTEEKTSLETQVNNVLDPKSEEGEEPADMKTEKFSEDYHGFSCESALVYDLKDGSCESDSSAILNEDTNNNNDNSLKSNAAVISSSHHQQFLDIHSGTEPSSMNVNFQFSSSSHSKTSIDGDNKGKAYDCYDYRIEEYNFFGHDHEKEEESCTNLFSDDQAPSLPWYCSQEWN